ncbi:MAG: ABC transporter permease [Xanthomonadales bacterium]|jgi:peptide/nickel transport system permease protein|nr:ABC transporter permease [Xanthomonadales bacterium]
MRPLRLLSSLLKRLGYGLALMLGVTLLSFTLMVQFGPDKTFELLGKNPTGEQIAEVRRELGYDRPFIVRYGAWLGSLVRGDLGASDTTGEAVAPLLARALPVTLALVLPGYLVGNLFGLLLGMLAAWHRGGAWDRLVLGGSVAGLSLSFLVIIILLQILLSTPYGLDLFPTRGWRVTDLSSYLHYVTVPTLALIGVTLGYNTRFYRAIVLEELGREHIRTARAFGATGREVLFVHVLRNGLVPIVTRLLYSIPLVVVSGSLLLETYFGIPGVGKITFDAMTSGDQPVLLAVVTLTAVGFVAVQVLADTACRMADPRMAQS